MMDLHSSDRKRKLDFDDDGDVNNNNLKSKKMLPFSSSLSLFTFIKVNSTKNRDMQNPEEERDLFLGYFQLLPDEILIKILKQLTIEELSILTMVNSRICNFIIYNFLSSQSGLNFILNSQALQDFPLDPLKQKSILNIFSSVGLLLKRSTFLFRTYDRIQLLIHLFNNSYGVPSIKILSYFDYLNFKLVIKCYGRIINKLIQGWGDFECEHVFKTLKDLSQIDVDIQKFLDSSLGSRQKQELMIRSFFRMICTYGNNETLDNFKDKLNWLVKILNAYPPKDIAKLLIVIFGPLVRINNSSHSLPYVAWWDLTDSDFSENGLEDFGVNFCFLFKHSETMIWDKDYLLQIFEIVISTPTIWTPCNVSTLLYHSGHDFTAKFLTKKFKDGSIATVANYLCYLTVVTHTNSQELSPILKIIDFLSEDEDGCDELIDEIIRGFSTLVFDVEILNDDDDVNPWGTFEIIESQLELMKLLFLRLKLIKKYF